MWRTVNFSICGKHWSRPEREVEERQKEWLLSETVTARAKNGLLTNLFLWQALTMVGVYIAELPRSQCTETELAYLEEHF